MDCLVIGHPLIHSEVLLFLVTSKIRVPNIDEYSSFVSSAYVPLPSSRAVLLYFYRYRCMSGALSPHTLLLKFRLLDSKDESSTSVIQIFCNRIIYQSSFSVSFRSVCEIQPPSQEHLETCFTLSMYFTHCWAYAYIFVGKKSLCRWKWCFGFKLGTPAC